MDELFEFTQNQLSEPSNPEEEYPITGPYITLTSYFQGVAWGVYGPDEDCRWVYINELGNLAEQSINHPRESFPESTIAVAYYEK